MGVKCVLARQLDSLNDTRSRENRGITYHTKIHVVRLTNASDQTTQCPVRSYWQLRAWRRFVRDSMERRLLALNNHGGFLFIEKTSKERHWRLLST